MNRMPALDVSALPTYAYGHRSLMWWSTMVLVLIEGTAFAIALVTYFYLRGLADRWPPLGSPPALIYGTINTLIMLASAIPNAGHTVPMLLLLTLVVAWPSLPAT